MVQFDPSQSYNQILGPKGPPTPPEEQMQTKGLAPQPLHNETEAAIELAGFNHENHNEVEQLAGQKPTIVELFGEGEGGQIDKPWSQGTTKMVGEEGGSIKPRPNVGITRMAGEGGGGFPTKPRPNVGSTRMAGEEGGGFPIKPGPQGTTKMIGEEGGGFPIKPIQDPSRITLAVGEGGDPFPDDPFGPPDTGRITLAVGEGGDLPGRLFPPGDDFFPSTTMAVGEEGGDFDFDFDFNPSTTAAMGEEGGDMDFRETTLAMGEEGGEGPIFHMTAAMGEDGGAPIFDYIKPEKSHDFFAQSLMNNPILDV